MWPIFIVELCALARKCSMNLQSVDLVKEIGPLFDGLFGFRISLVNIFSLSVTERGVLNSLV